MSDQPADNAGAKPFAAVAIAPPSWGRRLMRSLAPRNLLENLRNPILQKEMVVTGRRRSTYVTRGLYLLILLTIMVMMYLPTAIRDEQATSGIGFLQRVQELAPQLTATLIWFEFVALLVVGPMLVGGSLCDERRSGTLGALFTTPLSAFQIALGKLGAGIFQMLLLALLGLPILLAIRVFGGVQLQTVLGMSSVAISAALLASTLSLFYSAKSPRGFSAAATAIFTTLAIHGIPALVCFFLGIKNYIGDETAITTVSFTCAPATLGMSTAELAGSPVPFGVSMTQACVVNTLYSLAWSVLVFIALVFRLRKVMLAEAGSQVALLTRRQRKKEKRQAAASAIQTAANGGVPVFTAPEDRNLIEQESREVGDQPVLWRELVQPAFKSRTRMIVSCVFLLALLLFIHSQIDEKEGRHAAVLSISIIGTVIALLLSTGAASSAFTEERESRSLDVLMTTPLSAREIVWGKFVGSLKRQWFIPAMVVAHLFLAGVLATPIPFAAVFHISIILTVTIGLISAIGIWMSVGAKKSTAASIRTAFFGLAIFLLPLIVAAFTEGILDELGSNDWDVLLDLAAIINPIFLAISSITEPFNSWNYPSSEDIYEIPGTLFGHRHVGLLAFSGILSVVMGGYAILTWLVLWRARVVLGRQTNRSR